MNRKPSFIEKISNFITGKGFYLVVLVCIAAIGGAIAADAPMLLFPLLIALPLMLFFPRFLSCHVRLEGRNIRIRRFGREQTVPLSSLRTVYWNQVGIDRFRRTFVPRRLVLVFDGWSLELEQDSHLGLNDLHRRLSALLKITH